MHDVAAMGVGECVADPQEDVEPEAHGFAFVVGPCSFPVVALDDLDQIILEGASPDELHRQVDALLCVALHAVDRHDRGVLELGGQAGLRDEGVRYFRLLYEFRPEGL